MLSEPSAVPRTSAELAALEARYRPFSGASGWRQLHVDEPRWTRYCRLLTRQIRSADPDAWSGVQDRMMRAAALDSAALDGLLPPNPELTSTVLAASIAGPAEAPADPVGLVAECQRRALVIAGDAAAAGRAVDVNLIALLQDVITESQASYTVATEQGTTVEVDLPRRQYKPVSNYLLLPDGDLAVFAPAGRVADEMARLAAELGTAEFACLHPAVQAAYAHYALTAIHPFADGNGRLARTVASVFLIRATGLPFVVFADQWPAYYQALGAATQAGDPQPLVDHVCAATLSGMDLAAQLLARPAGAALRPGRPAAEGTSAAHAPEGAARPSEPSAAELDAAARELLEALAIEVREALVAPPRGVRMTISATRDMPTGHVEPAYRLPGGTARPGVRVRIRGGGYRPDAPGEGADLAFVALVSTVPCDLLPLALREACGGELLEVAFADAYPLACESAVTRIGLWARRLLDEALARAFPRDEGGSLDHRPAEAEAT